MFEERACQSTTSRSSNMGRIYLPADATKDATTRNRQEKGAA